MKIHSRRFIFMLLRGIVFAGQIVLFGCTEEPPAPKLPPQDIFSQELNVPNNPPQNNSPNETYGPKGWADYSNNSATPAPAPESMGGASGGSTCGTAGHPGAIIVDGGVNKPAS